MTATETLFTELALTCMRNGLQFDCSSNGIICIFTDTDDGLTTLTYGYIKDWEHDAPEDELERMLEQVSEHLEVIT